MLRKLVSRRTLAAVGGATALSAAGGYYYLNSGPTYPPSTKETRRPPPPWTPPSRQQMLDALKASGANPAEEEFDLLIVGGGATGAGVAVDAASRGLKVALVERDDFSSGMCSYLLISLANVRLRSKGSIFGGETHVHTLCRDLLVRTIITFGRQSLGGGILVLQCSHAQRGHGIAVLGISCLARPTMPSRADIETDQPPSSQRVE